MRYGGGRLEKGLAGWNLVGGERNRLSGRGI